MAQEPPAPASPGSADDALGHIEDHLIKIRDNTRFNWLPGWAVAMLILIAWLAAESHDTNCYTKATIQALASVRANEEPPEANCLLPWNDPS